MTIRDKRPRIAIVIRDLTAIGGAQLNTLRLIDRIRANGYAMLLIGQGNKSSIKKHLSKYNLCTNIDIIPVTPPKGIFRQITKLFPNVYFWIPALLVLWKIKNRFDILHCPLLMESGIICALCEIIIKKPSILKLGSAGEYGDVNRVIQNTLSPIIRVLIKNISMFVCISKKIENELNVLLSISKSKITRIPNGIDVFMNKPISKENIFQLRKKYGFPIDQKIVLFIGRLEEKKRVDFLIRAWEKVCDETILNPHLLIVGDGSLRSKLENYSYQLKLTDKITFYGNTPSTAVIMHIADIFVLPSVSEGIANVILEAMSCGLPIIATDTEENAELLTHNINSLLFKKNSQNDLAEKIIFLIKNEKTGKRLSISARNNAETNFNIEDISQKYIDLYRMLYYRTMNKHMAIL